MNLVPAQRQFDYQFGSAFLFHFRPDEFSGHGDPGHADAATELLIQKLRNGSGNPVDAAAPPIRPGVGPQQFQQQPPGEHRRVSHSHPHSALSRFHHSGIPPNTLAGIYKLRNAGWIIIYFISNLLLVLVFWYICCTISAFQSVPAARSVSNVLEVTNSSQKKNPPHPHTGIRNPEYGLRLLGLF